MGANERANEKRRERAAAGAVAPIRKRYISTLGVLCDLYNYLKLKGDTNLGIYVHIMTPLIDSREDEIVRFTKVHKADALGVLREQLEIEPTDKKHDLCHHCHGWGLEHPPADMEKQPS